MRHRSGTLVALPVIALALAFPATAHASATAGNLVDGSVVTGSTTCSWANASTSANPPDTATVNGSTVSLSCNSSTTLKLNNNPVISFNDAAATAAVDSIDISGTMLGMTCRYQATGLGLARSGDTRTYTGGPYTGKLTSGGFLCPGSMTLDQATISFH